MFDLEEEFKKLRAMCLAKIEERRESKELAEDDADALRDLVYDRMIPSDDDLYDGDDAWNASAKCW